MKQALIYSIILVALAVSSSVYASGNKPKSDCNGHNNCNTSTKKYNTHNSNATGGYANSEASAGVSDSGNSTAAADADASNSGNSSVNIDASSTSTQSRRPVNTAYAAPLVAGDDTCMGSTSAGGMGITFGFSFATTWKDSDCVIRKDARFLQNAQRHDIALSLMCSKPSVIAAVKRAGTDAEKRACGIAVDEPADFTPPIKPVLKTETGERG